MFDLFKKKVISKEAIASMLNTSPEALAAFEASYERYSLEQDTSDNLFAINAKQMAGIKKDQSPAVTTDKDYLDNLKARIVNELVAQTVVWNYDGETKFAEACADTKYIGESVALSDINAVATELRPQLSGMFMKVDINGHSSEALLSTYKHFMEEKRPTHKKNFYHRFRQGLDILDLDPLTYEIIGTNPNSMGFWLPEIVDAVHSDGFFKIPKTKIIKVPMTLLQLTRCDYAALTRTTLDIVDDYCMKVFNLDTSKDYFIKTGTYSSKFDFRNAHVTGEQEVRELGEYLLFIHYQALSHAHYDLSGLNQPIIYGMSTTNEWVVREFIPDTEDNLKIYHGLPLRTEYRVFVDFDDDKIIGISPYWKPSVMKERFGNAADSNNPDMIHDYITYTANEEKLMKRYNDNKDVVMSHIRNLLPDVNLSGQWSIDIMQNGDDFYIIDMAIAETSALYDCVPLADRRVSPENWLPEIK